MTPSCSCSCSCSSIIMRIPPAGRTSIVTPGTAEFRRHTSSLLLIRRRHTTVHLIVTTSSARCTSSSSSSSSRRTGRIKGERLRRTMARENPHLTMLIRVIPRLARSAPAAAAHQSGIITIVIRMIVMREVVSRGSVDPKMRSTRRTRVGGKLLLLLPLGILLLLLLMMVI